MAIIALVAEIFNTQLPGPQNRWNKRLKLKGLVGHYNTKLFVARWCKCDSKRAIQH